MSACSACSKARATYSHVCVRHSDCFDPCKGWDPSNCKECTELLDSASVPTATIDRERARGHCKALLRNMKSSRGKKGGGSLFASDEIKRKFHKSWMGKAGNTPPSSSRPRHPQAAALSTSLQQLTQDISSESFDLPSSLEAPPTAHRRNPSSEELFDSDSQASDLRSLSPSLLEVSMDE